MAANIFTGATNSNWGTSTNWSLGTVPTINDGNVATFIVTSPNCTVNTSNRVCNGIDFTGYINTITMSFDIQINGAYTTSPTMNILGSGAIVFSGATNTILSNGKTFPNDIELTSNFSGVGGVILTLLDNCIVNGSLNVGSSISPASANINGFSLTFGGGFSVFGNGNRTLGGTTQLIANGTGNFTTGVNSWIANTLEINTIGTITFVTRFYKRQGLFKYTAGTTQTNNCTFVFGSINLSVDVNGDTSPSATTLSTTGINFWRLDTTGTITNTLSSPIRVINQHTVGGGTFNAGSNIYNSGNIILSSNSGASLCNYHLDGTGTWSGGTIMRCNVIINTTGTITFTGNIRIGGIANATFTYVSGTTITTGSTLQLGSSATLTNLDSAGILWDNVQFFVNTTTNINSLLTANNISFTTSHTLGGTHGYTCTNLTKTTAGVSINYASGKTYTVTGSINVLGTLGNEVRFISTSPAAFFNLQVGATQSINFCNATWINSSGGQTIYSLNGTLNNTTNWVIGSPLVNSGNMLLMF